MRQQLRNARPTKASTWSRTGCVTCKRRRKKCDQGQPVCANCTARGIPCGGYQQPFVSQVIRGRTQQRTALPTHSGPLLCSPVSDYATSPTQLRTATTPTTSPELPWQQMLGPIIPEDLLGPADTTLPDPFVPEDGIFIDYPTAGSSSATAIETATTTRHLIASLVECLEAADVDTEGICPFEDTQRAENNNSHEEGLGASYLIDTIIPDTEYSLRSPRTFPDFSQNFYYIQYIHEQGARQLLNMDAGPFNPLRRLLLPRSFNSRGVLNALCAVAACHQAQRADPDQRIQFSIPATAFYLKATNWLRSSFDPGGQRLEPIELVDCLLTALLLCKYEIIQGSVKHWKDHLHGLENLMKFCGGLSTLDADFRRYIISFVRYHRTVAGICDPRDFKSSDEVDRTLETAASSLPSLDSYSGCANYLLRACRAISNLAGQVEYREIKGKEDLLTLVDAIVASLGSPNINPDTEICPEGLTISQIGRLLFVAQRIRYSAFVFLHTVLEYARTMYDFVDLVWKEIVSRIPYTKLQALDGCFEMLAETPVGEFCEFAALTLPLFLAGCEVTDEKRRYIVLDRLFLMERSFGIGNIPRARDALMTIWQYQNGPKRKVWWKVLQDMGWELMLS